MDTKLPRRLYLLGALVLAIALVSFVLALSKSRQQHLREVNEAEDRGEIAWYIRLAKATGDKAVTIPAQIGIQEEVGSLDDALARFRVVLAQPIETYTHIPTRWSLLTWYRFRVLEDLSRSSTLECRTCGSSKAPEDLLPVNVDEVLVPVPGGTLTVDGIVLDQKLSLPLAAPVAPGSFDVDDRGSTFSSVDTDTKVRKRLATSARLLLFLAPTDSAAIGKLTFAGGVLAVDADGRLAPIDNTHSTVGSGLQQYGITSFDQLKAHVRRLPAAK